MVRRLRPTSSTRPARPWRMTTVGGVARQTSRRFRGNVEALHPLQRRLAGSPILLVLPIDQDALVHMHDHLVAVARRAWVQISCQRALGHQAQRVSPPLAGGGLEAVFHRLGLPSLLVEPVGRRLERAPQHGAHLG